MTNEQMLNKLLAQSGWTVTATTADGTKVCKPTDDKKSDKH